MTIGSGTLRRQRREARPRRVAVQQHLAVRRDRVVDAGRRAVRGLLALERQRVDALERQIRARSAGPTTRTMATASAADPPSPIARGMCGNTSMSIVRSSSVSSRNSIARMPATPCWMFFDRADALLDAPARNQQPHAVRCVEHAHFDRQRNRRRDRVPPVHHRVLAEQDHFAVREAARFDRAARVVVRVQRADEFLRFPYFDFARFDQRFDDACRTDARARRRWLRRCARAASCGPAECRRSTSARSAAKFCARPTAAMIDASSRASGEPSSR